MGAAKQGNEEQAIIICGVRQDVLGATLMSRDVARPSIATTGQSRTGRVVSVHPPRVCLCKVPTKEPSQGRGRGPTAHTQWRHSHKRGKQQQAAQARTPDDTFLSPAGRASLSPPPKQKAPTTSGRREQPDSGTSCSGTSCRSQAFCGWSLPGACSSQAALARAKACPQTRQPATHQSLPLPLKRPPAVHLSTAPERIPRAAHAARRARTQTLLQQQQALASPRSPPKKTQTISRRPSPPWQPRAACTGREGQRPRPGFPPPCAA